MNNSQGLKPCPFCKGTKIKFSSKTMGRDYGKQYNKRHVAMYCYDCNCYGPRTIVEGQSYDGSANEGLEEAMEAWNRREE